MGAHDKTLLAFYDLTVSPLSYDFLSFLVVAEEERLALGMTDLHLVIVPFESGVGHWNNTQFGLDHAMWRLNQVVIPLSQLLPSLSGFTHCSSREHARQIFNAGAGGIFPVDYSVDEPIERHHTGWSVLPAHRGQNLQHLRATPEARNYARQWLEEHSNGKLPVALTFREARFTNSRDTDHDAWSAFAHNLSNAGYFPFILRDIDTALQLPPPQFEGITFAPEGVFNLELRMGLYEESHISAFVANGPAQACFYNRNVRFIYLVTGDWLHDTPTPFNRIGIDYGETPPFCNRFQRWIWEEQSPEVLMKSFLSLDHDIIESRADGTYDSLLDPLPEYRLENPVLAQRFIQWMSANQASTPQELALAESCIEDTDKDGSRLLNSELAVQKVNELENAIKQHDSSRDLKELEDLANHSPEQLVSLGMAKEARGNFNEATELYARAIERGLNEPPVYYRIAIAFKNCNRLDEAIEVFEKMIRKGARSELVIFELGQLYAETKSPEQALEFYDYWREKGITSKDIENYCLNQRKLIS